MMNLRRFTTPRNFSSLQIGLFLDGVSHVVRGECNGKRIRDCEVDTSNTKKISLAAILTLYKFLEFTVIKKCFYKPKIGLIEANIYKSIAEYGFNKIFNKILNERSKLDESYRELRTMSQDGFFLNPHPLLRNEEIKKEEVERNYLPIVKNKDYSEDVSTMIVSCLCELTSNFLRHAIKEDRALLVAKGDRKSINIAYIDSADGIISTMKASKRYCKLKDEKLLSLSFERNVTSQVLDKFHMGDGLWMISEIVKRSKGSLCVYSEGWCYTIKNGKVSTTRAGYWKGTIIDINLLVSNPITPKDLFFINEELFD